MTEYALTWKCSDCKTRHKQHLTELQAAFPDCLKPSRKSKCPNCGGSNLLAGLFTRPSFDDPEILEAWLADKRLYFIPQDEELVLSLVRSSTLVDLLKSDRTPRFRKRKLFGGLVFKAHDKSFADDEDAQVAKNYLREARDEWMKLKWIPFQVRKGALRVVDNV